MKTLCALVVTALFATVLAGYLEQHENIKREERRHAEQALDACWQNATANGGIGADVCKHLADSLNK